MHSVCSRGFKYHACGPMLFAFGTEAVCRFPRRRPHRRTGVCSLRLFETPTVTEFLGLT